MASYFQYLQLVKNVLSKVLDSVLELELDASIDKVLCDNMANTD